MCMKNVNISTAFCDRDLSEIGGSVKLGNFIDEIEAKLNSEGSYFLEQLTVVTFASAISGSNDTNLVEEYDILWILESACENENDRIQLAANTYDVKNNKIDMQSVKACRSFSNQIFKFTLRDLELKYIDNLYLLKTFMRKKGENTFEIQSINSIKVVKCLN